MNTLLLIASLLIALISLVHSILGEVLIFNRLRSSGLVPTHGGSVLREAHVRILWASWHVVTLLGWALAALLLRIAGVSQAPVSIFVLQASMWALVASALLVLYGTRGRHPAWAGLLLVALLIGAA
jgi:hypothetical protein